MARQSFNDHERVDRIDELLPQTQCGRCGYPGCRPYAEAIAKQQADINRCPPGGEATIVRLARLLGRTAPPLDPAYGVEQPPAVARVIESLCIGCTKCIQACPVDAIIGAAKQMHAVIADLCTGCELCLAPCPVDCIEMVPTERPWDRVQAGAARRRFEARQARLAPERLDDGTPQAEPVALRDRALALDQKARQALIRAAVERTRRKRAARRQTREE